jgi:two-component system KDP operon response regulator KdpE
MTQSNTIVVLIDGDRYIRRFVHVSLAAAGMTVFDTGTGTQGLAEAATRRADLVIVDLSLPDREGVDVIRELRAWSDMPVIVLSARSGEEDKVAALDAGADDYLTKPFGMAELAARIRAHLRRQTSGGRSWGARIHFGAVTVDLGERKVVRDSQIIHLSPIEFRLLSALARHQGQLLTHHQLFQEVWGPLRADNYHYLRTYMGHLRQKLERDPARPEHIVTETGVGYRLVGVSEVQSP